MINASFLYPVFEIVVSDLVREMQNRVIRDDEGHRSIFICNAVTRDSKIVRCYFGPDGAYIVTCIVLDNEVTTILHILHQLIIMVIHPFVGIISPDTGYNRIKLVQVIS